MPIRRLYSNLPRSPIFGSRVYRDRDDHQFGRVRLATSRLIGDPTSFFDFGPGNRLNLARTGGGAFNLDSLQIGPSNIGSGTTSIGILGVLVGGGQVVDTLNAVTTATTATLDWTNVLFVRFGATDDSGLDNIVLNVPVPEPAGIALLGIGLTFLALTRRRRAG